MEAFLIGGIYEIAMGRIARPHFDWGWRPELASAKASFRNLELRACVIS
jgi:hypothetical protein